jgi:glycosyltransferase involved in cell wall biosynthesis
MMRNRILLVHHGTGYGGGLIALLGLIKELQVNYEVTVFCIFDSEAIDYIRRTGVIIIQPKATIFYKYFYKIFSHSSANYFNLIKYIFKFYKFAIYFVNKYIFVSIELKKLITEFDLVYLNSTFISDWAYYPKSRGKKVIIHVREPLKDAPKSVYYSVIHNNIKKYCTWIIAITKDNANRIKLLEKTTIIYDPIVIKRNTDAELSVSYDIQNGLKYYTYVGGSSQIKGFEQMVASLKYLDEDVRIFFLGTYNTSIKTVSQYVKALLDPYIFRSIKLYKIVNQSPNAIVIGKSHDVFYFYKKSVAVISPFSKPHASLPILESLSLGVPVIVSDIVGMDEFVKQKSNGFFFINNNSDNLAQMINKTAKMEDNEIKNLKNNSKTTYESLIFNSENINVVVKSIISLKKSKHV